MKAKNIIWGLTLVFLGTIFLLQNFDVINFNWSEVWRLWPLYLIIWGVSLISRRYTSVHLLIVGVLTLLSLLIVAYKGIHTSPEKFVFDEKLEGWSDQTIRRYGEDFSDQMKVARLKISGGANKFSIKQTSSQLFEAETKGKRDYFLRKTLKDSIADIEFGTRGEDGIISGRGLGDVNLKLNAAPEWHIEVKMGAGKTDLDLRKFNVKQIELKGGAAEFSVKLGKPTSITTLKAETGMAAVKVEVPKEVACQIKSETALSSVSFEGFESRKNGVYQTPGFENQEKRIYVELKGGFSNLEVERYP